MTARPLGSFRRLLGRVRRRARVTLASWRRPVISVIIPMYNVEQYVGECLDSVLQQDLDAIEVLVVDDGSTDGSASIVRRIAARDPRVRLLAQSNAGQGPARNRAIRRARGEFLVFVDSDDRVPRGSFRYLLAAIERSGSDFAVGGVRRLDGDRTYRPSWTVKVQEHDRYGIRIDDFPAAMGDVVAHHRIIRRRFWTERIGEFSAGVYEDHVPMVAAYLRADRFDLLSRVVYDWRLRAEGTSTGQQKHDLANLAARIAVKAQARELVWREGSDAVRAAWVGRVLDIDFPPYIEQALSANDEYRAMLREALTTYLGLASPVALTHVRVRQKVRAFLAASGNWEALVAAEQTFAELGSIPPTVVRNGTVRLASPPTDRAVLPDEMLELASSESRLQVCLSGCEIVQPTTLRLTGWAVVRAVDLASTQPSIRLALVHDVGSRRLNLAVRLVPMEQATEWVNWPHGFFANAGFQTDIDLTRLVAADPRPGSWPLSTQVEVDGLAREGGVHHAVEGSSASRSALAGCNVRVSGARVEPTFDLARGFSIRVSAT